MTLRCIIVYALLLAVGVQAAFLDLYENSFVEVVDPVSFDEKVMQSKEVVIIQFYTSWSPNCKKIAPVWVEAAEVLKSQGSQAKLMMFDADTHREFSRRFKIDGYPTFISFGKLTKEIPEYTITSESTHLKVDEILEHVAELEAVTEEEAAKRLSQVSEGRKKGQPPPKPSKPVTAKVAVDEEDEVVPSPPKETKKRTSDKSSKTSKKSTQKGESKTEKPIKKNKKTPKVEAEDEQGSRDPKSFSDAEAGPEPGIGGRHRRRGHPHIDEPREPPMREPPHRPRFGADREPPHIHIPDPPHFDHPRFDHEDHEARMNAMRDRHKQEPPAPPSAEDEERRQKMIDEHWERVRQRKEEREDRRRRGNADEHDEMYFRHEKMIEDARRRHEDHMAEVMRRHEEAMNEVRRRVDAHRDDMDRRLGELHHPSERTSQSLEEPAAAAVQVDGSDSVSPNVDATIVDGES